MYPALSVSVASLEDMVHPQSLYLTALGLDWRSYEISLEA